MSRQSSRILLSLAVATLSLTGATLKQDTHARAAQTITLTEEDYYGPPNDANLQHLFDQYTAAHPNVHIKRTFVPFANLLPSMLRQAATHTMPDIVLMDNPQVADIASSGVLTDLTPYAKNWAQLKGYLPNALSVATIKGKLYGIPDGTNALALFSNTKYLTAAGITHPPVTWAEWRADAKKLTHGKVYGTFVNATDAANGWEPFFWSDGGDLRHVNSKAGVESLTILKQIYDDGSVSHDVLTPSYDQTGEFAAGNIAMVPTGPWELAAFNKIKGLSYTVTPLPVNHIGDKQGSWLGGEVWTAPSATPGSNQAAVWNFLQWAQQPARLVTTDEELGYIPVYAPAITQVVKDNPQLKIFAHIISTGHARATQFGANYPKVSAAIGTSFESMLSSNLSPQAAAQQIQGVIDGLPAQ